MFWQHPHHGYAGSALAHPHFGDPYGVGNPYRCKKTGMWQRYYFTLEWFNQLIRVTVAGTGPTTMDEWIQLVNDGAWDVALRLHTLTIAPSALTRSVSDHCSAWATGLEAELAAAPVHAHGPPTTAAVRQHLGGRGVSPGYGAGDGGCASEPSRRRSKSMGRTIVGCNNVVHH